MNKSYKQNNLIDVVEDVPTINCADVNAVLVAHYEASAKSDYCDDIAATISAVTSMTHTLDADCNSFENGINSAAA